MKNPLDQLQWSSLLTSPALTTAVTGLLVVWLATDAARLTWKLLPQPEGAASVAAAGPALPASVDRPARKRLTEVAALHLFGDSKTAPTPMVQKKVEEAPVTKLPLNLKGVFMHTDAQRAFAIIATPGSPDRPYRVGDGLPGGARLAEVYTDRVLLDRAGSFETLHLPQGKLEGGRPGSARAVPTAMRAPASSGGDPFADSNQDTSARLRDYRQKLLNRPGDAMQMARMQPVMEDGRLKGYRLSPGKDPQFFKELGLQPGDVVTSVNGIPLSDPSDMGRVLDQLTSAAQLDLQVENNGSQRALQLDFGQ